MGLFKGSEAVRAKKIGAHARYVDKHVQRIDLTSTDGETTPIDLPNAYGACRPALLDQKQVDRLTSFVGTR